MAMGEMKHARNTRKALVIVSDGGDNRSRHTEREIKNAMLESDLQVYAMGIFDPGRRPKHSLEEQNGPKLLEELADESGGREYPVTNLDDLAFHQRPDRRSTSQSVSIRVHADQLRARWKVPESLTFKVTPQAEIPDLRVYYRHGYYSPGL